MADTDSRNDDLPVLGVLGQYFAKEARDRLSDVGRLEVYETAEELLASKAKLFSLFVWHVPIRYFDEALMLRLPSLRLLVRLGVGYDNIDIQAAGRLGIAVCNVPAYGTEEVADAATSHILNLYRRTMSLTIDRHSSVPSMAKEIQSVAKGVTRLRGQKLGIIGLGRIGTAVCLRAKPFGMDISFYDPYLPDGVDKALGIIRHRQLDDLLGESDCISLHCSLTDENKHMLDDEAFRKMKRGVRLVNTARGGIVDERALAKALCDGRVASAALDVQETEPFQWEDSALSECANIYCMPHVAWYSDQSIVDMWIMGAEEVRRAVLGRWQPGPLIDYLVNCVNRRFWVQPSENTR